MAPIPFAAQTARPYVLYVIPRVRWDDDQESFETELRYDRKEQTRYPYKLRFTDRVIRADDDYRNRIQADGEVYFVNNNREALGFPVFLAALGELQHTQRSGFLAEGALELDFTVWGNPESGPSLALGGLGYLDYFTSTQGDSNSGFTFGVESIWIISDALEFDTEYDFKSVFNNEDLFAAKLFWNIPVARFSPQLFVGGAKHRSYAIGLRFQLR
ncbi:MAG TPA: hypothetical protein VF710_19575 [Longimicrobium sp.]